MKLENHVANRLLLDEENFGTEIIMTHAKGQDYEVKGELIGSMVYMLDTKGNKNFLISNTVMQDLGMFDAKKSMETDSWKIFANIPAGKRTYILPVEDQHTGVSEALRLVVKDKCLHMLFFRMTPDKQRKNFGLLQWLSIWVDTTDGTASMNWGNGGELQDQLPRIFSLLAFIHLGQNEEKILQPRERYGTAKTFKTQNIFPWPVTVINSAWNHTVKTGAFSVVGHLSIRWTGPGRTQAKLVYIQPYEKEGYTRTYKKDGNA